MLGATARLAPLPERRFDKPWHIVLCTKTLAKSTPLFAVCHFADIMETSESIPMNKNTCGIIIIAHPHTR